jgi:anion-transporting  ArsA/GET3 family ATPase
VAAVLRGVGKLTGGDFLEQMAEFITDLNDLFGGFRDRASRVAEAFRSAEVAYVMVTSPAPLAIREVTYFAERLRERGMRSDAFVVNRVQMAPKGRATEDEIRAAVARHGLELDADGPARIGKALEDEFALAERDATHLQELEMVKQKLAATDSPLVRIPALPSDVHDVATLTGISRVLCPEG